MFIPFLSVVAFFLTLYNLCGLSVTWISFFLYLSLPFIVIQRKILCYLTFLNKVRMPFSNDKNVKKFGIVGGRSLSIKHDSTIDKQEVELAVWHILPQSLIEKASYLSEDSEEINNFFDDQLKHSQKPIVVYCHGITKTVADSHRVALYKVLQQLDMHVITFDYRGFGDSTNLMPTRMGLVEDFLVVYSWARKFSVDTPVFVWGHSLGTGIILKALSKFEKFSSTLLNLEKPPPLPKALILESAFSRIADVIVNMRHVAFLLVLPYVKKLCYHTYTTHPNVRLNSIEYVTSIRNVPILMMHARDDELIPFSLAELLFKAAKDSRTEKDAPVTFKEFSKGGHMWICDEENILETVRDFVDLHKNIN